MGGDTGAHAPANLLTFIGTQNVLKLIPPFCFIIVFII